MGIKRTSSQSFRGIIGAVTDAVRPPTVADETAAGLEDAAGRLGRIGRQLDDLEKDLGDDLPDYESAALIEATRKARIQVWAAASHAEAAAHFRIRILRIFRG